MRAKHEARRANSAGGAGARAWRQGRAALLCLAASGWLGCATRGEPEANLTDSYQGRPSAVLTAAADLLRRQGYEVTDFNETFLELQGEKLSIAQRSDGSLAAGTRVTEQVLVGASAEGNLTRVNALFSVSWRRPTGEQRNWAPESSVGQRLRDAFYAELHREIGDTTAGAR